MQIENELSIMEKKRLAFYQDTIKYLFDMVYMCSDVWNGKTTYFSIPVFQNPFDLWILQEIIIKTKPNILIETGTAYGGSALYFGTLYENLSRCSKVDGKVITIDIQKKTKKQRPQHPRISYLEGSSISGEILNKVKESINETDRIMVILDSNHSKEYVEKELEAYKGFVSKDCYLVVCDTNLSSHAMPAMLRSKLNLLPPAVLKSLKDIDEYPMSAVLDFLDTNSNFEVDKECEKFGLTFNPNGFLRRIN